MRHKLFLKHEIFILLLTSLLISSCSKYNCNNLPTKFKSYSEATSVIRNTNCNVDQKIRTRKSSWIRKAEYCGCHNKQGYLIIQTDRQSYIHEDLPMEIWLQFKDAQSYGSYYSKYIKGKYQFKSIIK